MPIEARAPEVSVVMPCLNEAATIGACVAKARLAMEEHFIEGEVIVADNGSGDGSIVIAAAAGARVVHAARRGYGGALAAGIAAARGSFVIMGDADDSYDFSHIPRFLEKLREGDDLVMGNRFLGGIEPGAMPALHRYLGNPLLSGVGRLLFGSRCRDFHCGLRGFRREAIQRLGLRTPGMEFASEMVVKATLHGLRISEVPTTLSPDGRSRPPHLRSFRDGWRHLRFMLLFSPSWLFLYPGVALMAIGLFAVVLLAWNARTVGAVTFDVHTLLYAVASLIVGFQAVLFSVFARVFGMTTGLLPTTKTWQKLFERVKLEAGLATGAALFLAGLAGSVVALRAWSDVAFGPLPRSDTLRIVIPSVGGLMLGCEIVMASFLLSVLGLAATFRDTRTRNGPRSPGAPGEPVPDRGGP
ncbi:MAG TPA: glycosyltransferase family 2 protein [Pirellulales bacterium]|nr:glycosyltransferase family 2 protein [Pirellulales bacterium]